MARKPNPQRQQAFEIYKEHKGNISNRAIAEMLDVPEKTIGSWKSKSKDNWVERLSGVLHKNERSTPNETESEAVAQSDGGNSQNAKGTKGQASKSRSGNTRRRSGNPNPQNQFAERNTAAVKHGLFSRYIPKETLELMGMLGDKMPEDLLWDQILIQYAAIIRAQSIMHVTDKAEMIKELKKAKYEFMPIGDGDDAQIERIAIEEEYEFQFAWERQAQFLTAQSRAISELRTSINQFLKLADEEDERRLKLDKMALDIDKTNAEIAKLTDKEVDKNITVNFVKKE